ncbi:MAG: hypothetical protein NTW66_01050 [Candidatus Magasanikbacteria bacterium]|nr:hypothetical protein [Candidatus Magasanikbacteria bacterium]
MGESFKPENPFYKGNTPQTNKRAESPRVFGVKKNPENPHDLKNKSILNVDTWEERPHSLGVGKDADTKTLSESTIRAERQKELAMQDRAEADKKIKEINQKIAAMDITSSTNQDGQIADVLKDTDIDDAVEFGIQELTDAELEIEKVAAEEGKKLARGAQERAALEQFNRSKQAETKFFKDYGNTNQKKTGSNK